MGIPVLVEGRLIFFFNFRSINLLITVDFFQSMNNIENKQT